MNIAEFLTWQSNKTPNRVALQTHRSGLLSFLPFFKNQFESFSFHELEMRSNVYANTLRSLGVRKGMRCLVFLRPGLSFVTVIYALFKVGAIPIFIDPGMGVESMIKCMQNSQPEALIGISKIFHLKVLRKQHFPETNINISVAGAALGADSLDSHSKGQSNHFESEDMRPEDWAAILFTSGGTGEPKGVIYTHQMFVQQLLGLKQMFQITAADVDLPCFPLFALFSIGMGAKVVVPNVDLIRPSQVPAKKIVRLMQEHKVTFATGSPALWKNVSEYCTRKKIKLPNVRAVIMFGAPVNLSIHRKFSHILTNGTTFTPYGATESLPVSLISGREVLEETFEGTLSGQGTCVGYPAAGVEIQIRPLSFSKLKEDSNETTGEIWVKSKYTSPGYISSETKKGNSDWYFMGDLGELDRWGRLWFAGRKVHMVETESQAYYSEKLEPVINQHPLVESSALITDGVGPLFAILRKDRRASLPLEEDRRFQEDIAQYLRPLIAKADWPVRFLYCTEMPVDTRHNIKIDRIKLGSDLTSKLISTGNTNVDEAFKKSLDYVEKHLQ
ncbi:MAG: AMP-binding protein [Bacteriovoracaceae bacterium]|nr:AMP-binding protein [Bacteriovoracaceae bacterium]